MKILSFDGNKTTEKLNTKMKKNRIIFDQTPNI